MGIRRALLIAFAVPALLLGLLGMHVLSGAGHDGGHGLPVIASAEGHGVAMVHGVSVAHGAGAHAAQAAHAAHAAQAAPVAPFASSERGEFVEPGAAGAQRAEFVHGAEAFGAVELGAAALACVLALLASLLLVAAEPLRFAAHRAVAGRRPRFVPSAYSPRALSLVELSISRT